MAVDEGKEIIVMQTGVANTASVLAGLSRAGGAPKLSADPDEVKNARHVVLPGVGAFGAAMEMLREHRLVVPLRERIQSNAATLCICLGLQLLCEDSEESPGIAGLGILPVRVSRFKPELKVPQLGWNSVEADKECKVLSNGYAYFANSFHLPASIPGWQVARADYGGPFAAAIERGRIVGCQFHPELSGEWGIGILRRWIETC